MFESRELLIGLAAIFVLGIGAQWLAWRIRLPSILLLLIFGFIAGPVVGLIDPKALLGDLLFPVVSLSVALILFEGGLSLRLRELKANAGTIFKLVSLGAVTTWLLAAGGAWLLLDLGASAALVLGAILVVTGPTVIGPLLRHIRPVGRVGAIAKWEGIVIDPIGAVLALLVFEATRGMHADGTWSMTVQAAMGLFRTALVGVVIGGGVVWATIVAFRRRWAPDFLQSPILLMVVVAGHTASQVIQHDSGLLTVTLMGVILANQRSVPVAHLIEFKENLRVLLISMLFILLAANLPMSAWRTMPWAASLGFVAFLVVVVRPAAVWLSTWRSGLNWRERLFLAWLAPRGIVAAAVVSVFAFGFGAEGTTLVTTAFLTIVLTVAIYGLTTPILARRLGLSVPNPQGVLIAGADRVGQAVGAALRDSGLQVMLVDANRVKVRQARMSELPAQHTNILSEFAREELDLTGIGRLLAMTPNDEINSLAVLHFDELFERSEVYQLVSATDEENSTQEVSRQLRGRLLFEQKVTYDYLAGRLAGGATIKRTRLSETFDEAAFRERYGEQAIVLFVVSETGRLKIRSEEPIELKPGDTLICLTDPIEEAPTDQPASASRVD